MNEIAVTGLPKTQNKGIELTHELSGYLGWQVMSISALDYDAIKSVHYIGKCGSNGDMFSVVSKGSHVDTISIHKGHLNSGEWVGNKDI